jgi:DNA-directed RNA polymerase subunit RPC12/RpoP
MSERLKEYVCAECGGTFDSDRSDEEAHSESLDHFGVRGDAPGMVIVCDDCYLKIMTQINSLDRHQ